MWSECFCVKMDLTKPGLRASKREREGSDAMVGPRGGPSALTSEREKGK